MTVPEDEPRGGHANPPTRPVSKCHDTYLATNKERSALEESPICDQSAGGILDLQVCGLT